MWGYRVTVPFLVCFALGTLCMAPLASSETSHSSDDTLIVSQDIHWLGNEHGLSVTDTSDGEVRMLKDLDAHNRRVLQQQQQQQDVQGEETLVVTTTEELVGALEMHTTHIEIRNHLDLTTMQPRGTLSRGSMLTDDFRDKENFTRSIHGNCIEPPSSDALGLSGAPLTNWRPSQCVLLTDLGLMEITVHFWLDNIYVRHIPTARSDTATVLWCGSEKCNFWMTRVTLQGNGAYDPLAGAMIVSNGQLYAQDVIVTNFAAEQAAIWITNGATANFAGTQITQNSVSKSAVGGVMCIHGMESLTLYVPKDTIVRLQNVTIVGNTAAYSIMSYTEGNGDYEVYVFSDVVRTVAYLDVNTELKKSGKILEAPKSRPGIDVTDAWFLRTQEAYQGSTRKPAPKSRMPLIQRSPEVAAHKNPEASEHADDSSDPPEGWEIHAAVFGVGVFGATFILLSGGYLVSRYRKGKRNQEADNEKGNSTVNRTSACADADNTDSTQKTKSGAAGSETAQAAYSIICKSSNSNADNILRQAVSKSVEVSHDHLEGMVGHDNEAAMAALSSEAVSPQLNYDSALPPDQQPNVERGVAAHVGPPAPILQHNTFDLSTNAAPLLPPPGATASTDAKLEFLHQQLNSLGTEKPAIQDLVFLGSTGRERRQGGQGVVQMAKSQKTRMDYAIKFYVSESAFQEECSMYQPSAYSEENELIQFLPQVYGAYPNADKALVDAYGYALPPCIVMERGESLDIWISRAKPDRLQACMIITHLASRIKDLHSLGYVHRDLKPANVMWLPRENRWTIIDFGCVARAGEVARLGFSHAYAAPEVITAYRSGKKRVLALEAVDVWSLGVMAFELLTCTPAVTMYEGKEKVMDRIQGENGLQLPWEGEMDYVTSRRLGNLTDCITSALSRNPSHRPSAAEFGVLCNRALSGTYSAQM